MQRNEEEFTSHKQVADWYDAKFREMGGSWHVPAEEIDEMLDMLGVEAGVNRTDTLFEFGCGDGKVLERAALRGVTVVGIDISDVALDYAMQRMCAFEMGAKQLTLEEAHDLLATVRAEYKEFGSAGSTPGWQVARQAMEHTHYQKPVEWAISYGSLEHALDIQAAVGEIARILRPGTGRFLVYVPNEDWVHMDQPLETVMSANEWISIFNAAGLEVERTIRRNDNNIIIGSKPA